MDYRSHLLAVADAYCAATGLSLARVSTLVHNDGKRLRRMREGAGCKMDTFVKAMQWFSDRWPAGTKWPTGVARPTRKPRAA